MTLSVSTPTSRYIRTLRERMESDDLRPIEWWLVSPRAELACALSNVGQRLMRLGNRIDDTAPNGDEHEAWNKGVEVGRILGTAVPAREAVEAMLTRLGFDASDRTMEKLGYGPRTTVGTGS